MEGNTYDYKVSVPPGVSGSWKVEKFDISSADAERERLRTAFSFSGRGRRIEPGRYTRLMRGHTVVMSDTPDEIRDCLEVVNQSKGRVLINGLGLGLVVQAVLDKPTVDHVTVVEISLDVISLVGPHYKARFGDRLEIVEADALKWKPPKGVRYNVVWHDIWDNICTDNLPDMHCLHRKYGRRCDWQASWCRYLCEQRR